ncbi:hypothetical protein [Streptomyces sp. NBC_01716]|uniref:hypothetical protein n=1 Tax=Streptomyces sp. NBC_01716 TaxID=2975917 RepID=UPI002E36C6A8|nr:hypothetical protein [Streptomyces sp. NBC_01716]
MVSGGPGRLRSGTVALAIGLLLAGCSGDGDTSATDTTKPSPAKSGTEEKTDGEAKGAAPSPSATNGLDFSPDDSRKPRTRAEALRLARAVTAEPSRYGAGYVKRSPYESDPGSLAVLDEDCVWQREPLPPSVLTSFTRYSELPAQGDKGPIRIAATVLVHREEADANWDMARTLEEALRCPEQQLSDGERITGLLSAGLAFGAGQFASEDSISESGEYHSDELGGPHYYTWGQSRLGQVTVSSVGKGSKGWTSKEIDKAVIEGTAAMLVDVQNELEASA